MIKALLISLLTATLAHAQGYDARTADYLRAWRIGAAGPDPLDGLPQQGSIVAYYPLDGDAYDVISGTFGTWGADVTETSDAIRGTAASLNRAANSYVTTVNSTLLHGEANSTISVWVKLRKYDFVGGIVLFRGGGLEGMVQLTTTNTLRAVSNRPGSASRTIDYDSFTEYGEWCHLAVTAANTETVKLYKNGVLIGQSATVLAALIGQSTPFLIGYDTYSSSRKSDGIFDEVVIWNTALSSNEVYQVYQRDAP